MAFFGIYGADASGYRHMLYVKASTEDEALSKTAVAFLSPPDIMQVPDYISDWPDWETSDIVHWVTHTPAPPGETPILRKK